MELIAGMFCILVGGGCFWKAATGKDFYAATIVRNEHPWRYPTWLGRIVIASIGLIAIWLGIGFIRQGLR
jgi:hypothetical protein